MEPIFASMLTHSDVVKHIKTNIKPTELLPKMVEVIETYTLEALLPCLQQWLQKVQDAYPLHYNHKVVVCSTNAKTVAKETLQAYRTHRAEAKRKGIPAHIFNDYLINVIISAPAEGN